MRFLFDSRSPRVAIVGVGYVGTCLAVALAERGLGVVGVDNRAETIDQLSAGRCAIPEPGLAEAVARAAGAGSVVFTTDYDLVRETDVVIVTVGTPVDQDGALHTAQLEEACRELAPRLRPGHLVIIKSTVVPGVTRTLLAPLLESRGLVRGEDFGLAYCPERLAEGEALPQVRELPVVVGGCDPDSAAAAARFWDRALGVPVLPVASADVAEAVKLASNWWIDANVAIANEMAQFCAAFEIDVLEVIGAANSLPKGAGRVNILLPGVGVGGPCLVKDPRMTWQAARERGVRLRTVETARQVNDDMPDHAYETIRNGLLKLGKDPASARVAVLGASFKSDTGDLRDTPVRGVVAALRAGGAMVRVHDPLADPAEVESVLGVPHDAELGSAVENADCVAVLAGHRPFHSIDLAWLAGRVRMPCLVFDGRMYYSADVIGRMRALGFHYRGVGR